ncbi:aminoglycoside phosphotransferase family protein [Pseudonocardia sp.]|uniref:aminoglycoside phosphotransferase family protein n=1 Tax=Pseudonocardia sp. TaxID=60912 RepID=UPI0026826EE3
MGPHGPGDAGGQVVLRPEPVRDAVRGRRSAPRARRAAGAGGAAAGVGRRAAPGGRRLRSVAAVGDGAALRRRRPARRRRPRRGPQRRCLPRVPAPRPGGPPGRPAGCGRPRRPAAAGGAVVGTGRCREGPGGVGEAAEDDGGTSPIDGRPQLVHGDYRASNILTAGPEIRAVIDFDEVRWDHRITDVANAFVRLGTHFAGGPPRPRPVSTSWRGTGRCGRSPRSNTGGSTWSCSGTASGPSRRVMIRPDGRTPSSPAVPRPTA